MAQLYSEGVQSLDEKGGSELTISTLPERNQDWLKKAKIAHSDLLTECLFV